MYVLQQNSWYSGRTVAFMRGPCLLCGLVLRLVVGPRGDGDALRGLHAVRGREDPPGVQDGPAAEGRAQRDADGQRHQVGELSRLGRGAPDDARAVLGAGLRFPEKNIFSSNIF